MRTRSPAAVLAVDIGSTATRGGLFDTSGTPVAHRAKREHRFATGSDGTSVIDPDAVVGEVAEVIDELTDRAAAPVGGVALDTFASSLVGVDADNAALTPCFTYADGRCAPQLEVLRRELGDAGEAAAQQRTGCRLHTSYLTARLRWLAETQPAVARRVHRWVSLGEYVHLRLLGTAAAGTSTAAWTGMLDRRTGAWDADLLELASVAPERFSPIADPDRPYRPAAGAVDTVARRWPLLAGARWFPVITDGLASNVGAGAADGSTVALSAATSGAMRVLVTGVPETVPPGLWCYRVDAARCLLGGAVNDVGRVVSWLASTVLLDGRTLGDIAAQEPDPATPAMLPFLTGERSTGWASRARAVIGGVTAAATGPVLARAALEGVAITYRRIAEQLAPVTSGPGGPDRPGGADADGRAGGSSGRATRIHASGRVLADLPEFAAVLADALRAPVIPVTGKRVTLRGTALLALDTLAPGAERGDPVLGEPQPARAEHAAHYDALAERFEELYRATVAP